MTDWLHDPVVIAAVLATGLIAGVLGGMLGVGGSVIMIPGLTLVLGYDQHLYQASAMVANVAVSVPAALRHHRAGTIVPSALKWMVPAALLCVVVGVWVSNRQVVSGVDGGKWLGRLLAAFYVYVIYEYLQQLRRIRAERPSDPPRVTRGRCSGVAAVAGFASGLLGIGGGALAVPLQQLVMRLPLRSCIANSSALICVSSAVGAVYKCGSLPVHEHSWTEGVGMGLLLVPTAWIGGMVGASLTHRLPLRQVRIAFIGLMILGAWKMAAIPFPGFDT